jgi:glutathione-independent formaldehyde dehydrogenase
LQKLGEKDSKKKCEKSPNLNFPNKGIALTISNFRYRFFIFYDKTKSKQREVPMKAIVFKKNHKVAVDNVKDPKILDLRDAIIEITSSAICGSDLHMYDGRTDMEKGTVFGHEIMGVVKAIGPGVRTLKKGDRVVLPFNIACGLCGNCTRGITSGCLTTNPDGIGAAYGYADMGPYRGGQAEFVRVPYADFNCLKLPGKPGDHFEDDFLLLSDIFPTGYHGCELANVQPGSTVAIFGAGPVGLLAAHSALIRRASQVFVVDHSKERLKLAEKIGAIPIDFSKGEPAEQIFKIRKKNPLITESLRPGEEKNKGVMCGIDAVGYQAVSRGKNEDPTAVLKQLIKVVNPAGFIGVVGVYPTHDPQAKTASHKKGELELPFGEAFSKGLTIAMGQTPVKKYMAFLRDLIVAGKAKPSIIISDHISIEKAPEAYEKFDERGMGKGKKTTKVVIKMKKKR